MTAQGDTKAAKEAQARARACLDREQTHVRIGWWTGRPDTTAVTYLGRAQDLHGLVCTCCPNRLENAS